MKKILILLSFLLMPFNSYPAYIDGEWKVIGHVGEERGHEEDKNKRTGKIQRFLRGSAYGPFFNCGAGIGVTIKTYNTYTHEEFFKNPEFELFKKHNIKFEKGDIYVQRISCTSPEHGKTGVFYPFITQSFDAKAYYLFSTAIYIFENGR